MLYRGMMPTSMLNDRQIRPTESASGLTRTATSPAATRTDAKSTS